MDSLSWKMLPDLIINELSRYLSFDDLKNMRLTCRQWKNSSFDVWNRRTVVNIVPNGHSAEENRAIQCLQEFCAFLRTEMETGRMNWSPFRRFIIDGRLVPMSHGEGREEVLFFWETCGYSMTHLEIVGMAESVHRNASIFDAMKVLGPRFCPELKEMKLRLAA